MNVKETYLYFAENLGGDAAGDCITVPASRFLGCDPVSATTTRISFYAQNNNFRDDDILLTHVTGKYKEVCEALADALSDTSGQLVVFADEDNGIYYRKLRDLGCVDSNTELDITLA